MTVDLSRTHFFKNLCDKPEKWTEKNKRLGFSWGSQKVIWLGMMDCAGELGFSSAEKDLRFILFH